MTSNAATHTGPTGAWESVSHLCDTDGSSTHAHVRRLITGNPVQRTLSDAVHAICAVHGHHPGMIAEVLLRGAQPDARPWLAAAASGFADERAYLARLTAAVGPLPSTPGQAESESALAGERHALDMLAHSERAGCATGAAAALVLDWGSIRHVLDAAAERFGVAVPPSTFPSDAENADAITALGASPGCLRAMLFGAQQLFAQHRGLWSLLEARASAREDL